MLCEQPLVWQFVIGNRKATWFKEVMLFLLSKESLIYSNSNCTDVYLFPSHVIGKQPNKPPFYFPSIRKEFPPRKIVNNSIRYRRIWLRYRVRLIVKNLNCTLRQIYYFRPYNSKIAYDIACHIVCDIVCDGRK